MFDIFTLTLNTWMVDFSLSKLTGFNIFGAMDLLGLLPHGRILPRMLKTTPKKIQPLVPSSRQPPSLPTTPIDIQIPGEEVFWSSKSYPKHLVISYIWIQNTQWDWY